MQSGSVENQVEIRDCRFQIKGCRLVKQDQNLNRKARRGFAEIANKAPKLQLRSSHPIQ